MKTALSPSMSSDSPQIGSTSVPDGSKAHAKLTGIHEWLSVENRKVKSWWASKTGTEAHKIYYSHIQGTDGTLSTHILFIVNNCLPFLIIYIIYTYINDKVVCFSF